MLQLQQGCLLAELLLAVMLQHLAESDGDLSALSRLGDNRVSLHVPCMQVCACLPQYSATVSLTSWISDTLSQNNTKFAELGKMPGS